MNKAKVTSGKRFAFIPSSTNLILLTSKKGQEIGEQFTMNLLGVPHQAIDLPEKRKGEIFLISIEILKKLSKLANAVDRYSEEEKRLVNEFKQKLKTTRRIAHHSDILEAAVEEVLGQAKSTLDIAVKIFEPLFGIKPHTYGKNGKRVINALENLPIEDKIRATKIIQIIRLFQPYSETIIRQRTTTQHYKNIEMTPLIAEVSLKGKPKILVPRISPQQTAREFTEIVYHNVFVFIRDLLIFSFASRFYGGLVPVIIEEKGERIKKIGVTIIENALR